MVVYPVQAGWVRRAEWIWRERPAPPPGIAGVFANLRPFAQEKNRFVYFRKAFDLSSAPQAATLHISADGRYQLFINGAFLGRGPARCDPAFQYYDSYEISAYLRAGSNVIAVLAHSYGQDMSWYQLPRHEAAHILGCGGVFVQTDIRLGNGDLLPLDSDETWRYLESKAWQQDTSGGGVGFVEVYDARRSPVGWQAPEFDDASWAHAQLLKGEYWPRTPPVRPFPVMAARDIPLLLEIPRHALRLHHYGEVAEVSGLSTLPEQMGAEALGPIQTCRADQVDQLVDGSGPATVQTTPGKAVALVFDFGATVTGRPNFDITAPAGAIIDIGTSERLQDDHVEPRYFSFLTSENVDRVITRSGRQQWERFEWTGFRYLQLTIRNAAEPLTLHQVSLNFTSYPVEARGSFACSDELLNRVWQAGATTLQLCMHDGFEDCPQREQRQFVGDAYIESLTNYAAFGDPYLMAKFLRQVTQSQRADGMTQPATPSNDAAQSLITITDFCLYWLMAIREYVRYTGDAAIVADLYPGIERALGWFERFVDDDHLLNNLPHWLFVDWAQLDKQGQSTVINAQYAHTLEMCAELDEIAGLPARGQSRRELAEGVKAAINRHLWDETRGIYVDARADGVQSRRVSQHANGICLAYGIAPDERLPRIVAYITDPARVKLTDTGTHLYTMELSPFDEEQDVTLAQPFFMHHVHRGLIQTGQLTWVLDNMRTRWGAMLKAGSSTLWEHWSPLASQCHAWSTTPTYDLSTYVLGVAPLADGFAEISIAPQPGDLAWAEGRFPTPRGDIQVAWRWQDPLFELVIDVPESSACQVLLPIVTAQAHVNGQLAWAAGEGRPMSEQTSVSEQASGHLLLRFARGGAFVIEARRMA